ncbi:MAG TPA: ATP-binding cassette domain-containing protein, partial [Anaerolineaceae bacterium]|nr:ATP-binding cassette domain-containing protein [Anaerolineaceae bacterium]
KARIADSMRVTGIEALYERSLYELSGGEKQKVAIASVLALQPSILMLDEPTSNLDLKSARMIFEVLAKLQQTHQLTVIIIEHKVSLFQDLFKRCVHLENGKITFDGPITQSPFSNASLKLFPKGNKGETVGRAPILELKDWSCQYGNDFRLAIDALEIYSGEIIALVGANGSGKTTLLKSLAGLVGAQNGQLTFRGAVLPMVPLPQIGLVFQNADEQIFMNTVLDEVTYGLKNFHLHDDLHARQMQMLFDQFGLSGKASTNPHQLSYGEKKRLNLISTLVLAPCILLLDEIFIGQDMYLVNFILERLCLLRNQGVTVIAAIHDPAMMHRMADRILFLEDGKMRFCLPLQQALIWWQVNGYRDYLLEKELRI